MQYTKVTYNIDQNSLTQPTTEKFSGTQAIALRSIQKGIKYSQLKLEKMMFPQYWVINKIKQWVPFAMMKMYVYLRKQLYNEEKEVHVNLGVLKKEFDNYRTQAARKEKEIAHFKDQILKLKAEEESLSQSYKLLIDDLTVVKKEKEEAKKKYEENIMNQKSYKFMLSRLKHDNLCLKLKLNQQTEILGKKKQVLYHTDTKEAQSIQFNLQTKKLLDEMMKNIEQQNKSREKQLLQFKRQIEQRKIADDKRQDRLDQQVEIAEHALNDKDANEKKWRKLLLVHKFLQGLLKNKMEKEMKKFEIVEKAFQRIKTATGVTEAQEIVQKFLSKEETYGQLLGTIAESEKSIEHLKRKNENLNNKLQTLKDEVQVLEMTSNKTGKKGQDADLYKQLYATDDKAKKSEVMGEKLYQWSIKMLNKFDKLEKQQGQEGINYHEKFSRSQDFELFTQVSDKILEELQNTKQEEVATLLTELNKSNIKQETALEDYNKRNIRIKFKKLTQRDTLKRNKSIDSHADLSSRSNSLFQPPSDQGTSPNQSYQDSDNSEDQLSNDAEESNHIQALRDQVKREKRQMALQLQLQAEKKANEKSNLQLTKKNDLLQAK